MNTANVILGVTTSTENCGVALMRGGEISGMEMFPGARSCVEELVPRIERLLDSNGMKPADIDLFGLDAGPGGLTGLKIGIITVKTLAQCLGRGIVAVSSMRTLCGGAPREYTHFLPAVKCMKKEFFAAVYSRREGGLECVKEECLLDLEGFRRLAESAPEGALVLGDAVEQARAAAGGAAEKLVFAGSEYNFPSAGVICGLAARGQPVQYRDVAPNYLCLSNAERNFGITV